MSDTVLVSTQNIIPNRYQGRKEYTEIDVLARGIAEHDLKQPPTARRLADGKHELEFGHRRFEAFKWLSENWRGENLPDRYEGYTVMPLVVEELTDAQMYEGMVIENEHRQDLNDIEKALVIREYRTTFGKSSAEAGALLGMNEATVRGIERFLDLPTAAQKALAENKITQGTARSLLSAQRLGGAVIVKDALKDILAGEDGYNVDEIIERKVDRLADTVEMWGSYRANGKEKPRAGTGLWLLDMKNFPNKMLAPLALSDLVELGVVADDDDGNQTMAMRYIKGEDTYLRADIKAKIDHLINPPVCTACPFYTIMNRTHYCGMKKCHARKAVAFEAQKLADMSRSSKIAIYQESDGAYLVLDEDILSHKKAFEVCHADLRLLPKKLYKGYAWQHFQGLDNDLVKLVAVGESANRLETGPGSKKGGKKTEKEKAEMRAMKLYRSVRKELMWEYTAAAQGIFENTPIETLKKLNDWHHIMIDDRIPEEYERNPGGDKAEYQRRALVYRLIMNTNSFFQRSNLVAVLTKCQAITAVAAPKELVKRAVAWDAEIASLAKVVAVETGSKKAKGKK